MQEIYLDNAASTRVDDRVLAQMLPWFASEYGNPSSLHRKGIAGERALKQAREQLARAVGAEPEQVYFTSGGTEANALGILGAPGRATAVVVSAIEHASVLGSAGLRSGEALEVVPIGRQGVVDPDAFTGACLRRPVAVASLMLVSNELGTLQPVAEVAARLRAAGFEGHLHVDAVQALGKLPLSLAQLGADSIAVSAHKLHGPKGAGAVVVRKGVRLLPLWGGGRHEAGVRPGTENVPGIVGLGAAAEMASEALAAGEQARLASLRDRLVAGVLGEVPGVRDVCAGAPRAPHIAALVFERTLAEPLLHALEARGVFVSAGSACHSHERGPSHVATALGVAPDAGMIRFSLARTTTATEIEAALAALPGAALEARL
jgi:cysteine desulfurase